MAKLRILLLLIGGLLVLWLAACARSQPADSSSAQPPSGPMGTKIETKGGAYTDVSVAELQSMLKNKDFVFVNVHIPFEGNIPQTDQSIAYDTIEQHLDQLPADKNAKIVLYCRSDRMSEIASKKLVELGYTNIYNLDGGFAAWEQAGLPIER